MRARKLDIDGAEHLAAKELHRNEIAFANIATAQPSARSSRNENSETHDSNGIRGPKRHEYVVKSAGDSRDDRWKHYLRSGSAKWSNLVGRSRTATRRWIVPGYSTVENRLKHCSILDTYGVPPHCAVYYVGWNVIHNAHLPDLDPAYTSFHLLTQIESFVRKNPLEISFSPLARIVNRSLEAAFDTVLFAPNFLKDPPVPGMDVRLEEIFRRNLEAPHRWRAIHAGAYRDWIKLQYGTALTESSA